MASSVAPHSTATGYEATSTPRHPSYKEPGRKHDSGALPLTPEDTARCLLSNSGLATQATRWAKIHQQACLTNVRRNTRSLTLFGQFCTSSIVQKSMFYNCSEDIQISYCDHATINAVKSAWFGYICNRLSDTLVTQVPQEQQQPIEQPAHNQHLQRMATVGTQRYVATRPSEVPTPPYQHSLTGGWRPGGPISMSVVNMAGVRRCPASESASEGPETPDKGKQTSPSHNTRIKFDAHAHARWN